MGEKITIDQCMNVVLTVGHELTVVIRSEPGCGKSSLLKMMEDQLGDKYDYIYADCPVLDMSDVVMRIPNHTSKTLESYVSSLFRMDSPRPKVIMLDEFMKSPKMLQILWTRLMLERSVGDVKLPEGSIVFATSNNTSDGVGDTMLAHAGNRVMLVNMQKPDHKKWGLWATDNNISALTRAWVAMNPQCLNSYVDLSDDELKQNAFIFNPAKTALSFVSPRSLAKNDIIVRNRTGLSDAVTRAAMAGTIGQAGAESMASFFLIEKDLIPVSLIMQDPEGVAMPTNIGALLMILFNAVDEIETQDDLSAFMKFVLRMKNTEMQSLFYTMVCQSKKTVKLAKHNKTLSDWMIKNFTLFT
jgi:energy-coupling factor transporter ATP-binding protein EcfA2